MCGGKWSSSIRKNRENLPPLKTPYDDEFIEQLKPFIPVMRVANFLGGEPFLTPIYYKIWELIKRINPKVQINITTNGSIFNSRVRDLLENLPQSKIVVSLDSVNEKNYNFIRKNGNFKEVMKNIDKFIEMDKLISIAFCPLIQNVTELPDIIKFCIDKNVSLYINMVTKPLGGRIKGIHENEHINKFAWSGDDHKMELVDKAVDELIPEFCLDTLSATQLQQIIDKLNQHSFAMFPRYDKIYTDFINSLKAYQSK
jgi:MoaA/NifB/PqqE/SkfB family radical SAM enzyme